MLVIWVGSLEVVGMGQQDRSCDVVAWPVEDADP